MSTKKDKEEEESDSASAAKAAIEAARNPGSLIVQEPARVDVKAEGYTLGPYTYLANPEGEAFYMRKVDPNAERGNTHKLKSPTHTWEGTEEDFRKLFEKK